MIKNVRELMSKNDNYIEIFTNDINLLKKSPYILFEEKLPVLLKNIATDVTLYDFFSSVLKDFDFENEFSKARVPNAYNTYNIILPREARKSVAFVFCLLYSLDSHIISMPELLSQCFYCNGGEPAQFQKFIKEILLPFEKNTLSLLNGEDLDSEEEVSLFASEDKELDTNAVEDLVTIMRSVLDPIRTDVNINAAEREELTIVTEGLNNTIYTKNKKLILILYIGCKNTINQSKLAKQLQPILDVLESKLKLYGIK